MVFTIFIAVYNEYRSPSSLKQVNNNIYHLLLKCYEFYHFLKPPSHQNHQKTQRIHLLSSEQGTEFDSP